MFLIDGDGGPADSGEIVVRSRYLALGYWRDPEQTLARFRPDPDADGYRRYHTGDLGRRLSDGSIVHLGRQDFQIQVGGERVEAAEIEARLSELPGVRLAVVSAKPTASGQQLIAYVEPCDPKITETELRRRLGELLPSSMLPNRIVFCDKLPLTEANKIDRRALPEPSRLRPAQSTPYAPPDGPFQEAVASLFGEALSLDGVGAHDSLFELGGSSLTAMRIVGQIASRFGVKLDAAELFSKPSVGGCGGGYRSSAGCGRPYGNRRPLRRRSIASTGRVLEAQQVSLRRLGRHLDGEAEGKRSRLS